MAGCDPLSLDVRQRSESGIRHEECEKVSRMSVGGVFSYPRPRRERGVDSPGVRAVGESPWWRQTPNCMYAVCIPAIATVLRGKRSQRYSDSVTYTTCTVRNVRHTQGMWGVLLADCMFYPKGSSKERQGSSREYTPECHTGTHWHHDWHTLAHTGTHHWHTLALSMCIVW